MRSKPIHAAAAGIGVAAASFATWFAVTWLRYGRVRKGATDAPLLDRFIPSYDVVERHQIRIAAPPDVTLAAAANIDLRQSRIINAIFRTRAWLMRVTPDDTIRARAFFAELLSLGWAVLAEVPGREIVFGAVTQPWKGNVVFRGVAPDAFAKFCEPDYVKIVWNLRADPDSSGGSIAHTETRVCTTDAAAAEKFRRYWSFVTPGIVLIRQLALRLVKNEAEHLALARSAALLPRR